MHSKSNTLIKFANVVDLITDATEKAYQKEVGPDLLVSQQQQPTSERQQDEGPDSGL